MSRPRIVIDTNVVISAALKPTGLESQVIELLAYRAFQLFVSPDVLAEYRGVLSRPKFAHIPPERTSRLLSLLAKEATTITPLQRLHVSPHDDDNRFLECAEAAQADYLVTGNKRHFPKRWKRTELVNARELLQTIFRKNP
jgi:putative PIN family toxin of toxin-antitoxin system